MCKSKEEGGRRCLNSSGNAFSNYPDAVNADHETKLVTIKDSFEERPALALHAAVVAGRTGYDLSEETIEAGKSVADKFDTLSKKEIWEQWNDIVLTDQPSKALDAIHKMGWEKNFPELAAIRGVPQSTYWHPEGPVEVHTAQAADIAAAKAKEDKLNKKDRALVVMGAINHDFGKSVSTVIDDEGKISSANHQHTGVGLSQSFLKRIGASKDIQQKVPLLVKTHMHHTAAPSPRAVRRLMDTLENNGKGTTIEIWARVAEADKAGRGSAGTFGIRQDFLAVADKLRAKANAPKAMVTGDVLKGLGYKPGEKFKDIILGSKKAEENGEIHDRASMEAWLDKNFPDK